MLDFINYELVRLFIPGKILLETYYKPKNSTKRDKFDRAGKIAFAQTTKQAEHNNLTRIYMTLLSGPFTISLNH